MENLPKTIRTGPQVYSPKEKMPEILEHLAMLVESVKSGKRLTAGALLKKTQADEKLPLFSRLPAWHRRLGPKNGPNSWLSAS